ncbi:GMC oxidoreductase [Laccaria amethystina LaAM-08-1]|uniref:GMC oxidoreductase n=1 Tax=Laccaria amethystina LaAM-08-1 TaxID=1095629 RepID=A0A0C9WKG0_9AGAR|nr:GMC oxidoreductase [Laccaria amethystina LaAM-08-1]
MTQTNLSNRFVGWPRGKLLGGSSAINAMYLMEPGQHVRRNEEKGNFTPFSPRVQSVVSISYDTSTHESGGPMQVSYLAVIINITANWTSALADAGYPTLEALNGGVTMGAFITPSSINPANWTRTYSRSAYIDSLPPRSNLHIFPQATVT